MSIWSRFVAFSQAPVVSQRNFSDLKEIEIKITFLGRRCFVGRKMSGRVAMRNKMHAHNLIKFPAFYLEYFRNEYRLASGICFQRAFILGGDIFKLSTEFLLFIAF